MHAQAALIEFWGLTFLVFFGVGTVVFSCQDAGVGMGGTFSTKIGEERASPRTLPTSFHPSLCVEDRRDDDLCV